MTGAAGFIGSHVVQKLVREGYDVVALDCLLPDSYPATIKRARLSFLAEHPNVQATLTDLRSDDLSECLAGVDVVINEAAMPGLLKGWADFDLYSGCNLLAVSRLITASAEAGVGRFIQISTSSVYGTFAVGDEQSPTRPSSPYGVTKLAAEQLVMAHCESFGLPAIVLRYFSVYGPHQRPDMAFHRFAEAILDGRTIEIYGDGQASRSNTYVTDVAEATVRSIDRGTVGGVYNISGAEPITVMAALAVIEDELGRGAEVMHLPPRPGDQRETKGDATKAHRDLDWSPSVAPMEGLRRQARWHRSRRTQV